MLLCSAGSLAWAGVIQDGSTHQPGSRRWLSQGHLGSALAGWPKGFYVAGKRATTEATGSKFYTHKSYCVTLLHELVKASDRGHKGAGDSTPPDGGQGKVTLQKGGGGVGGNGCGHLWKQLESHCCPLFIGGGGHREGK